MHSRVLTLSVFACLLSPLTANAQSTTFSTTTYTGSTLLWNYLEEPVFADLNGDGRADVISAAITCSGSFQVALSTGDGAYATPVCYTFPSGNDVTGIVTGDFYGKGTLDLAIQDSQGQLYIYQNTTGNGALTLASTISMPAGFIVGVAADVNHDGHIDLVSGPGTSTTSVSIMPLLGNGDGTFTQGPVSTFAGLSNVGPTGVGDFNDDGKADILLTGITNGAVVVYGDNTGNFTLGPSVGLSKTALALYEPADIESNGTMDLIGAPYTYKSSDGTTSIVFGNYLDFESGHSNDTLTSQTIPLQHCAISIYPPQVADFDGDGINDLIVAEDSDCKGDTPYTLNFMKGNGNGTFAAEQVVYSTNDNLTQWYLLRASHSSKPDLALWQYQRVNNTLTNATDVILVNTTTGDFPSCTPANYMAEGINICGPTSMVGATSPVQFSLAGSNQTPGRDMEIWVDGNKLDESLTRTYSNYDFISGSIPLSNGEHQVAVYSVGWDYSLQLSQFPLWVGTDTCPVQQGFQVLPCSPISHSTLTSPVTAYASGNVDSGRAIVRMEIWVDGVKMYSTFGQNSLKTTFPLAPGWHQFTYYIVDNAGAKASTTYYAAVQ